MYKSSFSSKEIEDLFQDILKLDNTEECFRFFEDLCTIKEIQDMAQRWKVAKLLSQNVSYTNITNETKASTATISRVNKCLSYGAGGYLLMLNKINKSNS